MKSETDIRQALKKPYLYKPKRQPLEPLIPEEKPNPIVIAQRWLGSRLKDNGRQYFLDNHPVSLNQVMWATNRLLVDNGLKQITHNEIWRV